MKRTTLTNEEKEALSKMHDYGEMQKIAMASIERLYEETKSDIWMVCGPISTGGKGNQKDNIEVFNKAINCLSMLGACIFDQMPYEEPMQRAKKRREKALDGKYDEDLLYFFYQPIFDSGLIRRLIFIPGWQTSTGARWEYEREIENKELVPDWSEMFNAGLANLTNILKEPEPLVYTELLKKEMGIH